MNASPITKRFHSLFLRVILLFIIALIIYNSGLSMNHLRVKSSLMFNGILPHAVVNYPQTLRSINTEMIASGDDMVVKDYKA